MSRVLFIISGISFLAAIAAWAIGNPAWIALSLSTAFVTLTLATLRHPKWKQFSFTLWIASAVVIGLCYPQGFIGIGDFKYTTLFIPILQVIMFSMGTTLSLSDFSRVFKMPLGVFVGMICQFTIMPILGYFLATSFGFPPEIAAGLVLVGCSPSGLASNVMAFIAKANVAMSVTLTAMATLVAPFMTPFLMKLLAGQMIEINAMAMMWSMTKMVLIPVISGLVCHHLFLKKAKWVESVMPFISMLGIILMTVLTVAIGRDKLLELGLFLIAACLIHCMAGYTLGYGACRLFRLDKLTCRTIALEVGLQNSGMASGITVALNKVATMGLAPIVFGPIMNLTASSLANWWRNHPIESDKEDHSPSPASNPIKEKQQHENSSPQTTSP